MPCTKKAKVNWLDKAKFIQHYAVDGCSTTLKVFVETGWEAESLLVLGLVNTSPEDFVRFLLRPKGARTARHGIRGLGRNEAAAESELFPDTAKLAADTVHEATGWHLPTWGEKGDLLYEIVKPLESAAYYFLLANLVEDFAFDWYSGILLQPESKCDIGRFAVESGAVAVASTPYEKMNLVQFLYPMINAHEDDGGVVLEQGTWCVIFHVVIHRPFNGGAAGNLFTKCMVGTFGTDQCGTTMVLEFPEGEFQLAKKFVKKITAPDTFFAWQSIHLDGDAVHQIDYGVNIEAFRIT